MLSTSSENLFYFAYNLSLYDTGDRARGPGRASGDLHPVLQLRGRGQDATHAEAERRGEPHAARAAAVQHGLAQPDGAPALEAGLYECDFPLTVLSAIWLLGLGPCIAWDCCKRTCKVERQDTRVRGTARLLTVNLNLCCVLGRFFF